MSLKKQIMRRMEKQDKETLAPYSKMLKFDFDKMPKEDAHTLASFAKNGITLNDLVREVEKARTKAFSDTSTAVMKVMYACIVLVLNEQFGFTHDQCLEALSAIDHKMAFTIDSEEIVKEMEDKLKIRFTPSDGIERIERI